MLPKICPEPYKCPDAHLFAKQQCVGSRVLGCRYAKHTEPSQRKPSRRGKYLKYGLTPDQQQQLRRQQNYCCAICGSQPTRLVLDHDHKTGKARGYLCQPCNHRLIGLENETFRKCGIDYLENPPAQSL